MLAYGSESRNDRRDPHKLIYMWERLPPKARRWIIWMVAIGFVVLCADAFHWSDTVTVVVGLIATAVALAASWALS